MHTPHFSSSRRTVLSAFGLGAVATALAACGGDKGSGSSDAGGSGDKPLITTSCYPMQYLAEKVGGDKVELNNLAKPGIDPHGLELSVREVASLEKSALIMQIAGYQSALDDAITSRGLEKKALDAATVLELLENAGNDQDHSHDHEHGHDHGGASDSGGDEHDHEHEGHDERAHEGHDHDHEHEGHDEHDHDHAGASDAGGDEHGHEGHDHEGHSHGKYDPHMWHNPELMAQFGEALAKRLGEIDSANKQAYLDNAKALHDELHTLDEELKKAFDGVSGNKTFVTSHTAFAYLAEHYSLHQVGISGIDPETEPSPQRLIELEKTIKDAGVKTVFFETTASPKVAKALADNAGVKAEELDNLEDPAERGR